MHRHAADLLLGGIVPAVLREVHTHLGAANRLPGELHSTFHSDTITKLHMAEPGTAPLALAQPDLLDFPTTVEDRADHVLSRIIREAANPHSAAVHGAAGLRCDLILARPVCLQWLILSKIHTNWYTLENRSSQIRGLVHSLCVEELDMAEMAIPQLVHLQADHLDLTTWLEEVDDVLLCGVD